MAPSRGKTSFLWALGIAWAVLLALSWISRSPYFRHWEVLREGIVAFRPLTQLEMPACGDLGRNSHVSELQYWRRLRFTTDELGFRNSEGASWSRFVVVGDSFVVGSGLDDSETIPVLLSRVLGEPVTNYGCVAGLGPLAYLADTRSRELPPEVVVWAPAYRAVEPVPLGTASVKRPCETMERGAPSQNPFSRWIRSWGSGAEEITAWKMRIEERSTLTCLARSMFHELYWRFAGRPWEIRAIEVEGLPALVLTLEAQGLSAGPEARRLQETVEGIEQFKRSVSARGSRFVFAPIPDVGTIYEDHYPESDRSKVASPPFIDLVFRALASRGVACVDFRPALRESRFPYLYLRDDTHLSPRGAEQVGRALAGAVRTVLASER